MKKILGISLVAVLAATPLMAGAAQVPGDPTPASGTAQLVKDGDTVIEPAYELVSTNTGTEGNFATAGYVKGAYNAAIKAINTVDSIKQDALSTTNKLNTTYIATDENNRFVSDTEKSTWSGKQDALTKGDGIDITNNVVKVDYTSNGGLTVDSTNKTLEVVTDGSTIVKDGTTGALGVKANTFDAYGAASTAESNANTYTNNAITNLGMANYATKTGVDNTIKAVTGTVDNTKISTTGSVAVPTKAKYTVMETWGSDNPTNKLLALSDGEGTVVESTGQISATTTITAGAVSIDANSVSYTTANTTPGTL